MATGTITVFNTAKEQLCDGTHDLDSGTYKLAICDNTTVPTATTATPNLADFTEVGTGGTYVAGGTTITLTWVEATGTVTLNTATSPSWVAHASNDTDAYWGIVYRSDTSDEALCFVDLGGPVDMQAGSLTVALGDIFTLA
jgi:hypothetical protein